MEILHYCHETFGGVVTEGRVGSIVGFGKAELFETISPPQENPHLPFLDFS
jgi:hypothetical protein